MERCRFAWFSTAVTENRHSASSDCRQLMPMSSSESHEVSTPKSRVSLDFRFHLHASVETEVEEKIPYSEPRYSITHILSLSPGWRSSPRPAILLRRLVDVAGGLVVADGLLVLKSPAVATFVTRRVNFWSVAGS